MSLEKVWQGLEDDTRGPDRSGRAQRRLSPSGRREFFLGLDMQTMNRMLILKVAATSIAEQMETEDTYGLVVRIALRESNTREAEVALVLTDDERRDIFDLLIQDLVGASEQAVDEAEGVRRFLARLSDWQQLLRQLSRQLLSREGQQGLWGELWALREMVAPVTGLCEAVQTWRGPMGADQDFQLSSLCAEVKTSTASTLDRVEISSERQLDAPTDTVLLLIALSLDARPSHGETLPEMVRALRSEASSLGCLRPLDARLELSGYKGEHAVSYEGIGYAVRSFTPFRVEEGFPRITSIDLRTGVGNVRYSVSTAASARFVINEQRADELIKDLV